MVNASPIHQSFMEDDAAIEAAADERFPAKDAIRHRLQRQLLNVQARLDQQQEREQTSFDSIQAAANASRFSDTGAEIRSSPNAQGGPDVFAEIPQPYGLHNLSRHSVLGADGTEHSYYVLPENHPLELATLEPVLDACDDETDGCATESIDVIAGTLEQQKYEEEQLIKEQFAKCFHKASENAPNDQIQVLKHQCDPKINICCNLKLDTGNYIIEFSDVQGEGSACLNITSSDAQDFTLAMQQQDDERACNCAVLNVSESFATWFSQIGMEHSMRELRLLWDPGASVSLYSSMSEPPGKKLSYVATVFPKVLNLCNLVGTYVQQLGPHSSVLVTTVSREEWDPGDTEFHLLFTITTTASATKLQCTDICNPEMVHVLSVMFCASGAHIFNSDSRRYLAVGPRWTELNASALFALSVPCSTCSRSNWQPLWIERNISIWWKSSMEKIAYLPWDPGPRIQWYEIMGLMHLIKWQTYAGRHFLARKCGTHSFQDFVHTVEIICCPPAQLIQNGRNIATVFQLWRSIFSDMHYCSDFQQTNLPSVHQSLALYLNIWEIDVYFIRFLPP